MNWTSWRASLRLLIAGSILICLGGCGTDRAHLADAYAGKTRADIASKALDAAEAARIDARAVPDWPAYCDVREHTGVQRGDSLTVASQKGDDATGRANARLAACGGWYKAWKAGLERQDAPPVAGGAT
jgi:hypothetical protein